jgi:hypothetical protein
MRRLLVVLASLALLLTFAPVVSAATQNSCSSSDNLKFKLYENLAGDTSDGDDILWWCSAIASNLANAAHTLPGDCNTVYQPNPGSWNDCIDSVRVWLPSSLYHACFYANTNYGVLVLDITGPKAGETRYTFSYGGDTTYTDHLSSFKYSYALANCPHG